MKQFTKEIRVELEKIALKEIMQRADNFTINDIVKAMSVDCDDNISTEVILEVVYTALDYAFSEGYIDIYDQFSYMVDPVQQVLFLKEEDNKIL